MASFLKYIKYRYLSMVEAKKSRRAPYVNSYYSITRLVIKLSKPHIRFVLGRICCACSLKVMHLIRIYKKNLRKSKYPNCCKKMASTSFTSKVKNRHNELIINNKKINLIIENSYFFAFVLPCKYAIFVLEIQQIIRSTLLPCEPLSWVIFMELSKP